MAFSLNDVTLSGSFRIMSGQEMSDAMILSQVVKLPFRHMLKRRVRRMATSFFFTLWVTIFRWALAEAVENLEGGWGPKIVEGTLNLDSHSKEAYVWMGVVSGLQRFPFESRA